MRIDAEMRVALGTDVEVLLKVFLPDDLAATFALYPKPFRTDALFVRRLQAHSILFLNHAKDGLAFPSTQCRVAPERLFHRRA